MAQWFCAIGDRQLGPLSGPALRQMANDGTLGREDLVRQGTDGDWVHAWQVKGLFAPAADHASKPASGSSSSIHVAAGSAPPLKRAKPLAAKPAPPRTPRPPVKPPSTHDSGIVAANAPPAGIPVGIPVMPVQPASFVPPIDPSHTSGSSTDEGSAKHEAKRRKSLSPAMLTGALLGVIALVAIAGVVVMMTRGDKQSPSNDLQSTTVASASDHDSSPVDASSIEAASADADTIIEDEPAAATMAATADSQASPQDKERLNAVLREAGRWYDGSSSSTLSLPGVMKLRVVSAWLESELPVTTAAQHPPTAASASTAAQDKQYLMVKVELSNAAADQALIYNSWNGSGDNPDLCRAVLQDGSSEFARLVPLAEADLDGRRTNVVLQPGDSIEDLLVFQVDNETPDAYRLALPKAAIGRTKSIGFELPRVMLRKPIPAESSDDPNAVAATSEAEATRHSEPMATTDSSVPQAAAAGAAPPVPTTASQNGKQPDDVQGLLESIRNSKSGPSPP